MTAPPWLETERLILTIPEPSSAARLLAYAIDNRGHLDPWEPPRPEGYYTEAFWARRLDKNHDEHARDVSLRLCVVRRSDPEGPILGHANLSNFVRGAFQACHLGYSVDRRGEGKGLMFEALGALIPHAFGPLRMHRIMANHVPTNERSARLLRRLGFVVEGYARDYLFIGGAWRDHVLTSLTNPEGAPPST